MLGCKTWAVVVVVVVVVLGRRRPMASDADVARASADKTTGGKHSCLHTHTQRLGCPVVFVAQQVHRITVTQPHKFLHHGG